MAPDQSVKWTAAGVPGAAAYVHLINYGVPHDRIDPADSGSITTKPSHGTAEFIASEARYTPEPGYVGRDEFEYEAFAKGRLNQQLRLKVRVNVMVFIP